MFLPEMLLWLSENGWLMLLHLSARTSFPKALDRDAEAIEYALREHIISEGSADKDERMIREADAIIFALYPGIFPAWVEENQGLFKPGMMMTDVTGVKSCIVYRIQEMLRYCQNGHAVRLSQKESEISERILQGIRQIMEQQKRSGSSCEHGGLP